MEYGFTDILLLLGALGLFLYGMKVMSDALMDLAGDKMRNILATMTSNRVFAVLTGFFITAIIQSSSATTLMVVSFVNASLLTLTEAIGVILGAHIGTTVTAWLITLLGFKVSMSAIALPLVGVGFLLTFAKKQITQHWGNFIIGFGVLFIGLQFLKDSVPDIKQNPQILEFLTTYTDMGFGSILLFLAIGTLLTVVIQSSSATMALTLIMCHQGWIPFELAAAMVLGENIGTTITANLGAIVANYNAKRAARAHFISQTMGVILMLIILIPFLTFIDSFTQSGGISAFDSPLAIPVALSMFHTSFNIFNTVVLIWFIPIIVKIVTKMVPYVAEEEPEIDSPKYLDEMSLKYPQTAVRALHNEVKRLYEKSTFEIVSHGLNLHREDIKSDMKIKKLVRKSTEDMNVDIDELYYRKVKNIYSKIIEFAALTQSKFKLSKDKTKAITDLKMASRLIVESIKNVRGLQNNVSEYMASTNEPLRKEYNQLRRKISKILRTVYFMKKEKPGKQQLKTLQELKKQARKSDILVDGSLDKMIRKEMITPEMATSLINDSTNIADISKNMIDVAELLYIHADTFLDENENEIEGEGEGKNKKTKKK
jgi:phosphate:Na+ symporter